MYKARLLYTFKIIATDKELLVIINPLESTTY